VNPSRLACARLVLQSRRQLSITIFASAGLQKISALRSPSPSLALKGP
jgi:hypothetical protein